MKQKSLLALCGASTSRQSNLMLAAALVALLGSPSAHATTATWAGTTNGTWATLTNWTAAIASVPGTAPSETATFNTNPTVKAINLGGGVTIFKLDLAAGAGAYTIGTGAVGTQNLTFETGGTLSTLGNNTNAQIIAAKVLLGTDTAVGTFNIASGSFSETLTISGGISGGLAGGTPGIKTINVTGLGSSNITGAIVDGGASAVSLSKGGNGIFSLSAANTYTGATAVNTGVLNFKNTNAKSSGTTVTATSTGTVGLNVGGAGFYNSTDVDSLFANTLTGFSLDPASGVGIDTSEGDFTYGTNQGGLRGLTKIGANTLTLTGTNTYSGQTTITQGSISVASLATQLSNTQINLGYNANVGTLNYTGTGETTSRVVRLAGTTGNGTITHSGTGLLEFNGNVTAGANGAKALVLSGSTAGTGKMSGIIADGTGLTSVTKTGTGTWTLSGVNTYTGTTTAAAGILVLDKTGTGTVAATSKLGFSGGTLQILAKPTGATTQTVASLGLNAGGLSTLAILPNGGDSTTLTITAAIPTATAAGTTLVFDTSAGTPATAIVAWSPTPVGGIIGANYLMKDNAGLGFATVTLGNVTRFVPGTVLDAVNPTVATTDFLTNTTGTITNTVPAPLLNSLTVDTTAGSNIWDIGAGNTATLSTGGILMTGSNDFTISNGTLKSSTATASRLVLNHFGTGVLTINSTIADGIGASTLNKLGTGTVILSGTNSYTGATNLNGGILKAGSATAFNGTSILSPTSNATLDLNGYNAAFTNIANTTATNIITNTGAADATLSFSVFNATCSALITEGSKKLALTLTNTNSAFNLFKLDSPNTFSGGITLTGGNTRLRATGGTIVNVGTPGAIVSSPFGRGPINLGSPAIGATDKGGLMFDTLTVTNTVLNEIIFNTELGSDTKGVRVNNTASNFTLAGDITASLADAAFSGDGSFTISGSIKGPNGLEIGGPDDTTRTVTLTAASNPYIGGTTILKGVLAVSSIANQLGTATTPIAMGATGAELGTARLRYTGVTNETTSRGVATSGVLGNTATIEQAGSGLLKFTGPFSVASANNRHLILDGSNPTGTGEISGVISDATGFRTQVSKNGSGTWTLSGLNTYTSNTVVNTGSLIIASTGQLTFKTTDTSGSGNNALTGAGTVTLNGSFVIDTAATDASALTSGSWVIENATSLPGAYGASFTVVGWTNAGSDTWTKSVGLKNYTFNETTGTVSMVEAPADPYLAWIATFEPNVLLPDAASKLPNGDPDADGINNLLEFVLTGSPVVSSQSINPTLATVSSNQVLSYKRSDASEAPATIQVGQWSTNLGTWTDVAPFVVSENGPDPDDMSITVPNSNAVGGKLFLRLNVVK